jgi:hypothetical protein
LKCKNLLLFLILKIICVESAKEEDGDNIKSRASFVPSPNSSAKNDNNLFYRKIWSKSSSNRKRRDLSEDDELIFKATQKDEPHYHNQRDDSFFKRRHYLSSDKSSIEGPYLKNRQSIGLTKFDFINCDCRSEQCQMRFRFLAFSQHQDSKTDAQYKTNIFQNIKRNNKDLDHRNVFLTINLKDVNDNLPKFKKNFINLSIAEYMGSGDRFKTAKQQQNEKEKTNNISVKSRDFRTTKLTRDACPYTKTHLNEDNLLNLQQQQQQHHKQSLKRDNKDGLIGNEEFSLSNTLLPLEKAIDVDSPTNARINYALFLFNNNSKHFLTDIELETDLKKQQQLIRNSLSRERDNCYEMFQLVESDLTTPIDQQYKNNIKKDKNDNNEDSVSRSALLFLKVNKFLDRELEEVYNFIIIAMDNDNMPSLNESTNQFDISNIIRDDKYLISDKNYMLIR